jgi:hypothetical protein
MRIGPAIVRIALTGSILLSASIALAAKAKGLSSALDTVQPNVSFDGVPLSEAIDFLRDSTNANIIVDWKSLEAVNIDRNTLINMRLHGVTLRKVLTTILGEAGAGNLLTFYVEDNVLTITTQAKADSILYTMVYPVKDLLVVTPKFTVSDVSSVLQSSGGGGSATYGGTSGAGGGGGGAGLQSSSSNIFGGGGGANNTTGGQSQQQMADALVKLIMDTIRPEIWKENGGNSTVRFFQGNLIITAPLSVQEAIGGPVD